MVGGDREEQRPSADNRRAEKKSLLPAMALPKGGGAIRSVGEKFSTNLATGAASLTVPIATPARGNFELKLELSYDSGAGNGPFGVGWRLSVPSITRKTDKGLPRYLDAEESDVFILAGAEDLVPQPGFVDRDGFRVRRYRPRVEGQFARIERWTDLATSDIHWRVINRDNVTSLYGTSAKTRIADPAAPERVFSWLLEETGDDRGNIARYTYLPEDGAGVQATNCWDSNRFSGGKFAATAQRYLGAIEYGNRTPNQAGDFMFQVVFDYGEHSSSMPTPTDHARDWPLRQDAFSSYRSGFEVRTCRLCRRVLVFHSFAELGARPTLVRSLDLAYDPGPVISYLTAVTPRSYRRTQAGYDLAELPTLTLDYTRAEIHDVVSRLDGLEGLRAGVDGKAVEWVDLDGEGIAGALTAEAGGWYYKANLGDGRLGPPLRLRSLPAPAELQGGAQQLTDLDGDGLLELAQYTPPLAGHFSRTDDAGWTPFAPFRALPNLDFKDPNLRFLDVDGDGFADILITCDDAVLFYRSRGKDGFAPAVRVARSGDEEQGPAVLFADGTETVQLADMSGDGLVDLVRVRSGEVCYWPNLGYGRFGAKVTMALSARFDRPEQFDPRRVRFADIDGSGTSDIAYLGRDGVRIYLNQAGNGFAGAVAVTALPPGDSLATVTVVDLLGSGTACLVRSSADPARERRPVSFIDLMGGRKPHLLRSTANGLGAETAIFHASSTRFYLADKAAGQPWLTRLAFPVQVVERVEIYDRISRNRFVTRYLYHHGHYDGVEREFRGFGMVEQHDTEELGVLLQGGAFPDAANVEVASHVPPRVTKTWFHTGIFVKTGPISRHMENEYFRPDGLTDAQFDALLLPDTVSDPTWTAEERRQACRALKGSILRQETFALDGSDAQGRPYNASERNYGLIRLQAPGEGPYGVFLRHARETLDYHYERDIADPRIQHELILDVDDFGNIKASARVGYPRQNDDADISGEDRTTQKTRLVSYSEFAFTAPVDDTAAWRAPLLSESQTFELLGVAPSRDRYDVETLRPQAAAAAVIDFERAVSGAPEKRRVHHTRTIYRKDDLSDRLPLHVMGALALPFESYELVFTPGMVQGLFGARAGAGELGESGYVHSEGDAQWWAPSGKIFYSIDENASFADELTEAQNHFFLARRLRDPFGHDFRVTYDANDLLLLETRDPLENRVTAGIRDINETITSSELDYRVLQPRLVMDPNRNRSQVAFDIHGLVVGTAVMGKPEESLGDIIDNGFIVDLSDADIAAHLANPLANANAILARATTRVLYDLLAYQRSGVPPVVYTLTRETHDSDGGNPALQHELSYCDGFTREIQKKRLVEDGPLVENGVGVSPRWVGSGWTLYNNKGKPVRRYEPFFSADHRFQFDNKVGVASTLFYDPLDRVVGTLRPDHSWDKTAFDPWRQIISDVNDTVLQDDPKNDGDIGGYFARLPAAEYLPTWYQQRANGGLGAAEADAAEKTKVHSETPEYHYFDTLARSFLSVAKNRFDDQGTIKNETHATRSHLDLEGQVTDVVDPRRRTVVRYQYDLRGKRIAENSMDGGNRLQLDDIAGKNVWRWNARNQTFHTLYDGLRRPIEVRVRGAVRRQPNREILLEKTEYGEGRDPALNARTRIYRQSDGAGISTHSDISPRTRREEAYDFKGNLLRSRRQLTRDYRDPIDWSQAVDLESQIYSSATTWDALNRPVELTTPDTSRVRPIYNQSNLLERIEANLRGEQQVTQFIDNVDYNAKQQRVFIQYHNGAHTDYHYDPLTFRLVQLTTKVGNAADAHQDLQYAYDPMGNVTSIRDDAQYTIYFRNRRVDPTNDYKYDSLYRLISAFGREHLGQLGAPPVPTSDSDAPRMNILHRADGGVMGRYQQRYVYDEAGNLTQMIHAGTDPQNPGWTRTYHYDHVSALEPLNTDNRLTGTQIGNGALESYSHDDAGNMDSMPHLQVMTWDCRDQLESAASQALNDGTPETTWYLYDAEGRRVRKVTDNAARGGDTPVRAEERVYIGKFEVYRKYDSDGNTPSFTQEALSVFDQERAVATSRAQKAEAPKHSERPRLVLVETRVDANGNRLERLIRFQHENHLGSAALELDEGARIVSYEEYYPYGSTSFQSVRDQSQTAKRYRFSRKERDDRTGLYYFESRYQACWLGIWTSVDPLKKLGSPARAARIAESGNQEGDEAAVDKEPCCRGESPYRYCKNNPATLIDPDGCDPPLAPEQTRLTFDNFEAHTKVSTDAEQKAKPAIELGAKELLQPDSQSCFKTACQIAQEGNIEHLGREPAPRLLGRDHKIQVATAEDRFGRVVVDPAKAAAGVAYIDKALERGVRVVVGVSYLDRGSAFSRLTEHYVTIHGRAYDETGRLYYKFRDPAISNMPPDPSPGVANDFRRLYVDKDTNKLFRPGFPSDPTSSILIRHQYDVTEVRTYKSLPGDPK